MLCLRRPNNPFCRLCFAMLFFHPQIFFQLGLDFLAGLQRCDFWTVKKPFPLTTAAQNIQVVPTYISRFSVTPHYIKSGRVAATNAVPQPFLIAVSTSRTNGPRLLSRVKAGTHSPSPTGWHTAAYAPKQGTFRMGRYHYPRHEQHVHEHPRAGCQNGKLCRFWALVGGALEEHRKPSEQRCAYACRCPEGVAAPLGCVIQ